MNLARTYSLREASQVVRYHTVQTIGRQTVAEHSYHVAMLVLRFTDGNASQELLKAVLYHDLPEVETGDLPATFKWANLGVVQALNRVEEAFDEKYGTSVTLTDEERLILKAADILELVEYCIDQMNLGNRNMRIIAFRGLAYAKSLPFVNCHVEDFIHELELTIAKDFS